MKAAIALLVLGGTLLGASVRLYLTDGTYHFVREYEIKARPGSLLQY